MKNRRTPNPSADYALTEAPVQRVIPLVLKIVPPAEYRLIVTSHVPWMCETHYVKALKRTVPHPRKGPCEYCDGEKPIGKRFSSFIGVFNPAEKGHDRDQVVELSLDAHNKVLDLASRNGGLHGLFLTLRRKGNDKRTQLVVGTWFAPSLEEFRKNIPAPISVLITLERMWGVKLTA